MSKNWLCKLGFHKWDYNNPLWRICVDCGRQEVFKALVLKWVKWEEPPQEDTP